jgi:hypothetical protein
VIGPYGARYPWLYVVLVTMVFALLIVHFLIDGTEWSTVAFVLLAIAVFVRPGGIKGPRSNQNRQERVLTPGLSGFRMRPLSPGNARHA